MDPLMSLGSRRGHLRAGGPGLSAPVVLQTDSVPPSAGRENTRTVPLSADPSRCTQLAVGTGAVIVSDTLRCHSGKGACSSLRPGWQQTVWPRPGVCPPTSPYGRPRLSGSGTPLWGSGGSGVMGPAQPPKTLVMAQRHLCSKPLSTACCCCSSSVHPSGSVSTCWRKSQESWTSERGPGRRSPCFADPDCERLQVASWLLKLPMIRRAWWHSPVTLAPPALHTQRPYSPTCPAGAGALSPPHEP